MNRDLLRATRRAALLACLVALALAAPGSRAAAPAAPSPLPSPAGAGAVAPGLASGPDGRVWLTWLEPRRTGGHALRYASLRGTRWTQARSIAAGDSFFVNGADVPGLLPLGDGTLVAHWRWRTGADPEAYEVRLSRSGTKGSAWTRPIRVHDDASNAEHGFVSMVPGDDGVVLAWLDGRKGAGMPEGAAETELRSSRLTPGGSVVGEQALDARVCDCCPTAAVAVPGGTLIAYRDRSPAEVRDIALVRRAGGRWSAPYPLHADGWTLHGCPVNGPALAASGDRVAAAWFTAAGDAPRVLAAFSRDGGATFGAPVVVDGVAPLGRVQILMLRDGSALVAWLGAAKVPGVSGRGDALLAARVSANGRVEAPVPIARATEGRPSGVPRMAFAGESVVFAWTEARPNAGGDAKRGRTDIRLATVPLDAFRGGPRPARTPAR